MEGYPYNMQGGNFMDFNGINNSYSSYDSARFSSKTSAFSKSDALKDADKKAATNAYSEPAATYEASTAANRTDRSAVIAHLKSSAEQRMQQMQSLVTKMFEKQGITIGTADNMWRILAGGNFTADAATIAQAKEDISEDGYWGVNQTSERIFSFAAALSGGDEEKMQEMVKAVEKGFSEATKAWGKELPGITQDTHSAIMDKFDKWFEENGSSAKTSDILA